MSPVCGVTYVSGLYQHVVPPQPPPSIPAAAVLSAAMLALQKNLTSAKPLSRPKTRVWGLAEAGARRIGRNSPRSRGPHWEKRAAVRQHASAISIFENWNRYYDTSIGRYLSPEPLLQEPSFAQMSEMQGHATPVYSYALNNPIRYSDPTGRDVCVIQQGAHQAVAVDIECKEEQTTCHKGADDVLRLDFGCDWNAPLKPEFQTMPTAVQVAVNTLACGLGTGVGVGVGRVQRQSSPLNGGDFVLWRCKTDCKANKAALEALKSLSGPDSYNVVSNNCYSVVEAVLRVAGCKATDLSGGGI
jgi:RHS repeat-associated protein